MWRKRFKKPGPKRLERTRGAAFPYFLLPSIGCLLALLACASAGYRSPRKGGGEAIASHADERGGGKGKGDDSVSFADLHSPLENRR